MSPSNLLKFLRSDRSRRKLLKFCLVDAIAGSPLLLFRSGSERPLLVDFLASLIDFFRQTLDVLNGAIEDQLEQKLRHQMVIEGNR